MAKKDSSLNGSDGKWTFLSNYAHVILYLYQHSNCTLRTVSQEVGITERAVQKIVADLEADGFLEKKKEGRKNTYKIHTDKFLRHPIEKHRTLGKLIELMS